jgi:hypothetical protein
MIGRQGRIARTGRRMEPANRGPGRAIADGGGFPLTG